MKQKADRTIRAELKKIEDALYHFGRRTEGQRRELFGAQRALMWARGEDVMPPCKSALMQ